MRKSESKDHVAENKCIVVISPSRIPGTAGDTANYSEVIAALAKKEFNILVICPPSPFSHEISFPPQVRISRIPLKPPRLQDVRRGIKPSQIGRFILFSIAEYLTIFWHLKEMNKKYVFMRHDLLTLNVSLLLKVLGAKVIVADGLIFSEGLNNLPFPNLLRKIILYYERAVFKYYSYFLVSTMGHRKKMQDWGYPVEKVLLMPMSVNISEIPVVLPNEIPAYTFGFFGALEPWQGPDLLLRAFRGVVAKLPDSRLYIIGDGSMKGQLKEYVLSNNISKNVIFVDGLPRKKIWHDYFNKFQIVVIPRPKRNDFFDTLPSIKLAESLAAGKAIITTDIDAMKEISPEIIITVPPDDPESLGNAMFSLSKDADKINKLSCEAVKYSKNYDISVNIEKIVKIFSESLTSKD